MGIDFCYIDHINEHIEMQQSNLTLIPNNNFVTDIIGGDDITSIRPIFDTDDRNIIVACERQLIYYNVQTQEQSGKAYITSSKLEPNEKIVSTYLLDKSLYTFTDLGKIFVWNMETRDWISELVLPIQESETLISCKIISKRQYIYSVVDNQSNTAHLFYSMSRSERERPKQRVLIGECDPSEQNTFDVGCLVPSNEPLAEVDSKQEKLSKQRCIAFINGTYLYCNKISIGEKFIPDLVHRRIQSIEDHKFTCLRMNPRQPMIAAGDTLGRIYIYTGDLLDKVKINRTKLHWHTLPVNDLCFSSTGNTLFSVGGESGCVVIWDLTQSNLGQKRVVARLGMPIRHVNCGNNLNHLVLSFEDNEIQFMDTNSRTKHLKTLSRRTIDIYQCNDPKALRINSSEYESSKRGKSIGLLWHSPTDTVITNGRTGWLQFFSPQSKTKLHSHNFLKSSILNLEKEARVIPSEITKAAVTIDGEWLAFYETRVSEGSFPEVKLHIWQRSSTTNRWAWIQTADRLHSSTSIADLKFSPDGGFLISVSEDGTFHVLHRVCLDAKTNSKNKQMYAKGFIGNAPQNLPAMAAFSRDSSVMALSLKNDTTLIWMIVDPYKLVYECQLNRITPEINGPSSQVASASITRPAHDVLGLHFGYHNTIESLAPLCEVRSDSIRISNILNAQEEVEFLMTDLPQDQQVDFTAAAFDQCPGDSRSYDHFAVCTKNNQILIFRLHIAQTTRKLCPLIVVNGGSPFSSAKSYFTDACFMQNPILDIDDQCHRDHQIVKILNRLCLMNNRQELVAISDKLSLEGQTASNNCNSIKTFDMKELQAYFVKSSSDYHQETCDVMNSDKIDPSIMTEKQRRIRKRLEVQKMLKDLLIRIPSQNLPKMDILGPMILDRLI